MSDNLDAILELWRAEDAHRVDYFYNSPHNLAWICERNTKEGWQLMGTCQSSKHNALAVFRMTPVARQFGSQP